MKRSFVLITTIVLITILFGCKKEDNGKEQKPEISFVDFNEIKTYYQLDTLIIKYELNNFELDSICLYIQDVFVQSQLTPQNEFVFIANSLGSTKITLAAFNNGAIQDAKDKYINVYRTHNNVSLLLKCATSEGDKNYYVGDRLIIYVEPEYEIGWQQITKYKEITFYLNGENSGTKYSLPFVYETGIIDRAENTVELAMVDKENHIYSEVMQLTVPVNTPPEIEYEFKYKYGVKPGYFFSIDPVVFSTSGTDNGNIHYIEYYIDGNYYFTDTVKTDYLTHHEIDAGLLSDGEHTSYCIAYDNRGISTTSETLHCVIYGAVQIDQDIVDIERTLNANVVYAITDSILYKINPVDENIEQQFPLPYQGASCVNFDSETQRLYIGFQDGHLVYFEELSNNFTTIPSTSISEIVDLEIDHSLNRAMIVSNEKIVLFDLSSDLILDEFSSTEIINSLAIDKQNKIVIASANPHSTGGYLYKLNYSASSISLNQQKYGIGFPLKIQFKSNYEVFTVITNGSYGFNSYNTNNLATAGRFSETYSVGTGCYSSDGDRFFMDISYNNLIDFCSTSDYSIYQTCYLPLESHNQVEFLTTNSDDSKLIILTDNVFYDDVMLVFINF